MVRRLPAVLLCLLCACSPREGTVLRSRNSDATIAQREDAAVALDAAWQGVPDARVDLDADLTLPVADSEASDADIELGNPALTGMCRISGASSGFYETFGGSLLSDTWLLAHGTHSFAGKTPRGGFVRDNVALRDGTLVLSVRGDRYTGPVRGIDAQGRELADGRRSGAAIVTRDLFASGTYQMQGRFVAPPGVEVALWVMGDDDSDGAIDIAVPGRSGAGDASVASYGALRMRSRTSRDPAAEALQQFALGASLDDGQAHILRFDWYTVATPAAQFWVDDMARWSTPQHVGDGATRRMWIVAWLPDDVAADFETAEVFIDNAFVTPFGNDGDRCTQSTLRSPGLAPPR